MFNNLIPWKKRNENQNSVNLPLRQSDDPFAELRRDFDRLLNRFWEEGGVSSSRALTQAGAQLEFDENEKEYLVSASLPGFEPEEIEVSVSGSVLNVRARRNEEFKSKNGHIQRFGSFFESFTLPNGVKAESIEANYRRGVLEVHLPKDDSKPTKRIAIKSA